MFFRMGLVFLHRPRLGDQAWTRLNSLSPEVVDKETIRRARIPIQEPAVLAKVVRIPAYFPMALQKYIIICNCAQFPYK